MEDKIFTISDLYKIIAKRKKDWNRSGSIDRSSYTAMLLQKGTEHIQRKLLEETLEVILDSHDGEKGRLCEEIGDLIYHIFVLAASHGIRLIDIEDHLSKKHKSLVTKKGDRKEYISRLNAYAQEAWPFEVQDMLDYCSIPFPKSADVLLFSHNFRLSNFRNVRLANRFPTAAKQLRIYLQSQNAKVKMVVPKGEREEFQERRDSGLLFPVVFVLNSVFLPLYISILAAYIKEWLDKTAGKKSGEGPKTEINIGVLVGKGKDERWYTIKGSPAEIYDILLHLEKRQ